MSVTFSNLNYNNTDHEWLTYESLFNHTAYRHTNRPLEIGAYRMPLANTKIVMLSSIFEAQNQNILTFIRKAFFPDIPDGPNVNSQLKSLLFQPWTGNLDNGTLTAAERAVQAAKAAISTPQSRPASVIMPYNFAVNDATHFDENAPPLAIGTDPIMNGAGQASKNVPYLHRLRSNPFANWKIWQTASRSCVVDLASHTYWTPGNPPPDDKVAPYAVNRDTAFSGALDGNSWYSLDWAYRKTTEVPGSGQSNIESLDGTLAPLPSADPALENVSEIVNNNLGDYFKVAQLNGCFSVKSGVMYVGSSQQSSKDMGKSRLDKESILACLRSEYVLALDQLAGRAVGYRDDLLVILPEVLTLTAVGLPVGGRPDYKSKPNPVPAWDYNGDGFQLRDLSQLDHTKKYFPPFSATYVGVKQPAAPLVVDFTTLVTRYKVLTDASPDDVRLILADTPHPDKPSYVWANHWKGAYAEKLGQAKALLLLRYGFQSLSPNAQNFLLEYNADMTATGRIVIRDLGDLRLHTEWVWAVFGPSVAVPATGLKKVDFTAVVNRNVKEQAYRRLLTYETVVLAGEYDLSPSTAFWSPQETGGQISTALPDIGKSFPPGTQLNWFLFSALTKGSGISKVSPWSTDPQVQSAGWQKVLAVNAWWGIAHTKAFAAYLLKAIPTLKLDISTFPAPPKPDEYLALANDNYVGAEALDKQFVTWEAAVASAAHAALFTGTGPDLLRKYLSIA